MVSRLISYDYATGGASIRRQWKEVRLSSDAAA